MELSEFDVSVIWVIIGAGNGLAPGRRQAITWTNDDLFLIGSQGTHFCEILIKI